MERIQAAIQKAKERRGDEPAPGCRRRSGAGGARARRAAAPRRRSGPPGPSSPRFEPDPRLMARNRIVTFADTDPVHTTFDMMRTKLLRAMRAERLDLDRDHLAVVGLRQDHAGGSTSPSASRTSPRSGPCSSTSTCAGRCWRRPSGITTPQSMASVLQGTRPVAENFVRYGETLAIGTNAAAVRVAGRAAAQLRRPPAGSRR